MVFRPYQMIFWYSPSTRPCNRTQSGPVKNIARWEEGAVPKAITSLSTVFASLLIWTTRRLLSWRKTSSYVSRNHKSRLDGLRYLKTYKTKNAKSLIKPHTIKISFWSMKTGDVVLIAWFSWFLFLFVSLTHHFRTIPID